MSILRADVISVASGGGSTYIAQGVGGVTLTNVSTIQGDGFIGYNGLALDNQSGGTVNANVSGSALTLNGGPITNAGLLEAKRGECSIQQ